MPIQPKPNKVCITDEEAMEACACIFREAQYCRQLQQHVLAQGNYGMAEMLEKRFMMLTALTNKLANTTRKEYQDDGN